MALKLFHVYSFPFLEDFDLKSILHGSLIKVYAYEVGFNIHCMTQTNE